MIGVYGLPWKDAHDRHWVEKLVADSIYGMVYFIPNMHTHITWRTRARTHTHLFKWLPQGVGRKSWKNRGGNLKLLLNTFLYCKKLAITIKNSLTIHIKNWTVYLTINFGNKIYPTVYKIIKIFTVYYVLTCVLITNPAKESKLAQKKSDCSTLIVHA